MLARVIYYRFAVERRPALLMRIDFCLRVIRDTSYFNRF